MPSDSEKLFHTFKLYTTILHNFQHQFHKSVEEKIEKYSPCAFRNALYN